MKLIFKLFCIIVIFLMIPIIGVKIIDYQLNNVNMLQNIQNKDISDSKTKNILTDLFLVCDFNYSKKVYSHMSLPSDGYSYIVIKTNEDITKQLHNIYKQNEINKVSENKKFKYKELTKNESIKFLKKYCEDKEILKSIEMDFNIKNAFFAIMEIDNTGIDNSSLFDEKYIISYSKNTLYIFYQKI